jgi:MFS family permease
MELGSEAAYTEERERGARAYLRETRATLRIPTVRSLYVGLTVAFMGFNGIAYWLPEFWERTHGVSESTASIVTAVVSLVVAIAGSLVGGVLGDRWNRDRPGGRIDIVVLGLVSGAAVLFVALALPTLASQALVLGAAAFLLVLTFPNLAAATADVLPAARRGMGFALFTFLVQAGSALGPLLVGIVSDLSGSLGIALAISIVPTIPGALVVRRARHTIAADIASARSG